VQSAPSFDKLGVTGLSPVPPIGSTKRFEPKRRGPFRRLKSCVVGLWSDLTGRASPLAGPQAARPLVEKLGDAGEKSVGGLVLGGLLLLTFHKNVALHLLSLADVCLMLTAVGLFVSLVGALLAKSQALVALIKPSLPLVQLPVSTVHPLLAEQRTLVLSACLRRH
jgi:hypothetical protein